MPGSVLEASTPAAAMTKPCRVCEITVSPRRATTRSVSSSIALTRSGASRIRPSALLTILEVTTRMSPLRMSAYRGRAAMSSPGRTSPMPCTPKISICRRSVIG